MVLHQNKWDRKATRAHVRKLKVKGKGDDTKPKAGTKGEGGTGVDKKEFPKLPGGTADGSEDEETDGEEEHEGETEEGESGDEHGSGGGQFSRRKMQSNSWRYKQEEEEEPVPGEELEDPEPEPDYVAMTRERGGQLEKSGEKLKEDLDEDFLKDLQAQKRAGRGLAHGEGLGGAKGKVVMVDRKQFEDVTAKIAKQSTADAFRQRFAPRKAKPRGTRTELDEDVDSFLGELKLNGITAQTEGSREISGRLGRSHTSGGDGQGQGDDWLDSMLGGR